MFIGIVIAPAAFFIAPQPAHASAISCIGGLLGLGAAPVAAVVSVPVSDAGNLTQNSLTAGASTGSCINDVVLIPLARIAIRAILQQMTASVIRSIDGQNSSGAPQFVTNLAGNLQLVGDQVGLSFIAQIGSSINSPFAAAISSSLRTGYLQQTSLAGFFAANQCTLGQSSPNINAFLAGNWSQGGAGAWFALTTQNQNNPFTLQQAANNQLRGLVGSAQTNQRQTISQNNGFLSWCSPGDITKSFIVPPTPDIQPPTLTQNADGSFSDACPSGTTNQNDSCVGPSTCPAGYSLSSDGSECTPNNSATSATASSNMGQTCLNSDGTSGTIETPGSIIHDYTQEAVVNSGFQQLISANDLDNSLGAILSALLTQVLNSAGGLLGGSSSSGSSSSIANQLQNYSSSSTATQSASQIAQTVVAQITTYTSAWNTINSAAQAASSALTTLGSCAAQSNAAQTALLTEVQPVLINAQRAFSSAATTNALALKVETESSATSAGSAGTLTVDVQSLAAAPPQPGDIAVAQSNATATGAATSTPLGSLTVSQGTTVDQMNLIASNAAALASSCSATH